MLNSDVKLEDPLLQSLVNQSVENKMLNYLKRKIVNVDVSKQVGGHLSYMENLPIIFDEICKFKK